MLSDQFWQGVKEFNQEQFYTCHDTLEALWMEASEPDKTFYQGVLQIAVACYHLSNLNSRGAVILLGEGCKRLNRYQSDYEGVNVTSLLEQSLELLQTLQHLQPEQLEGFLNNNPPLPKIVY